MGTLWIALLPGCRAHCPEAALHFDNHYRPAMNGISRLLHARIGSEPIDAWLSQWGCTFGALTSPLLAAAALRDHSTRQEFVLGVAAAAVAGLLLLLLGRLARQVHLAAAAGRVRWRSRRGELLSHERPCCSRTRWLVVYWRITRSGECGNGSRVADVRVCGCPVPGLLVDARSWVRTEVHQDNQELIGTSFPSLPFVTSQGVQGFCGVLICAPISALRPLKTASEWGKLLLNT